MHRTFEIRRARDATDLRACAELFREYEQSLPISLDYQDFGSELSQLPGKYSPPGGRLLLARNDGLAAGCIALRRHSASDAEIKRLYVRPQFRGSGLGRKLVLAILEVARNSGYAAVKLDTLRSMDDAARLYRALGFSEIVAYYEPTPPGTRFFNLELDDSPGHGAS